MAKRDIIVIGASSGGMDAIKALVANLPEDLAASIFIVWHMPSDASGILPQLLNRLNGLPCAHAIDNEPVMHGRIYIAPPDRHLLLEEGRVRVTRGPKENRFRPAVDPLFRSAAYVYGQRVIGVILSGALDDGTAGMWLVKERGGLAVVQDPGDAEVSAMPENAARETKVDYSLPAGEIGPLLAHLVKEELSSAEAPEFPHDEQTDMEIDIAMGKDISEKKIGQFGEWSPFTCPECHGTLMTIAEGNRKRFRCHTGHAFSADSLLSMITENVENDLWGAVRCMQESVQLLNHIGDHLAEKNMPKLAALYFRKAMEAESRIGLVREAVQLHEPLSGENITQQYGEEVP